MLARLKRIVGASESEAATPSWHVIDLCTGKGFLATLIAVLYPHFVVTAVDKRDGSYLPHYEAAGITNVRYAQLDVLAPSFASELGALIQSSHGGGGRRTVVLGMHLCGLLSLRAVDLLEALPEVEAVVLAPCCLPGQHNMEDTPVDVFRATGHEAKYVRWCTFVEGKMRRALARRRPPPLAAAKVASEVGEQGEAEPEEQHVMREMETALVSGKNVLLTATRTQPATAAAEGDAIGDACVVCDDDGDCGEGREEARAVYTVG